MAKRNKKGGWTGTRAGANAIRSGGGPQVEKNFGELKKYDAKRTPFQKAIRVLLFILVCVLAGSLIYQATPKNMAEYWELDKVKESIACVEVTTYEANGGEKVTELTAETDIETFYTALDESSLKRLWFPEDADSELLQFTSLIRVFLEGETEASYEVGFVDERVYFIGMPTYDWYLPEDAPVMEYVK